MKLKLALCSLMILAAGVSAAGAAPGREVRATVDRNRIGLNERLDLTITIEGAEGVVDIDPITDFRVLSRGSSTSIRIVDGQTSRQTALNYTLIPLKAGRLTIPALKVRVAGKALTTEEIGILVTQSETQAASHREIFATSELSKTDPYVGEQVTFHLRLHHAVRIADPSVREIPDFEGFSAKQLEAREGYRRIVDGREYIVRELAYVLSPLTPGAVTIGPALISCDIYRQGKGAQRGGGRLFDDLFFNPGGRETVLVRTDPITVNVRPLPPDDPGAPAFSGLIGRFTIEAGLENGRVRVGEAATLFVTLSGSGNVMDAALPDIPVPDGLKAYADAPRDDVRLTPAGYEGQKTFRTALVGVTAGTYAIDPIRIRYFDTVAESYKTLFDDIGVLTVLPGDEADTFTAASGSAATAAAGPLQQAVAFTGRDILPVSDDLGALKNRSRISLPLFVALLAAPCVLCLGVWGLDRLRQPSNDPGTLMARRARRELKAAQTAPDDRFLSHLSRSLIAAILSRAGTRGESLTYREAEDILTANGLEPALARKISRLLDRIDSGLYGGDAPGDDERRTLLEETRSFVTQVIKA